jgi:hypothetical protein
MSLKYELFSITGKPGKVSILHMHLATASVNVENRQHIMTNEISMITYN